MQTGKGISIPSILKVGKGALTKIGSYLKNEGIEQAVIFFGNGLIDMFGTDVMNSLKQEDIKGEFKHGILKLFVPKKEAKKAVEENKYIAIEG